MKKDKKTVCLRGSLLYPIQVGKSAVIFSGGSTLHTSRVVAVHEDTADRLHFETLNTHYNLVTSPFPLAAVSPLPVRLAACA